MIVDVIPPWTSTTLMSDANPYKPPQTQGEPPDENVGGSNITTYLTSLGILVFLTLIFQPGDTGIWSRQAIAIELLIYLGFVVYEFRQPYNQSKMNSTRPGACLIFTIVCVVGMTILYSNNAWPELFG